jgi:beta-carotene 3-hydroxylase
MTDILINVSLVAATFVFMEGVAYYSHKYVMHGVLWCWHESHHLPREGTFEKNDLFAAMFAIPSILCIGLGTYGYPRLLWVGIGIALYGLMYFIFHDVIVHRRVRTGYKPGSAYMRRIVEAHWVHHSTNGKEGAVSFGFLYSPPVDVLVAERDRLQGIGSAKA